jgi:glycine/D-amino acid oxidase-like deaminating enzyme
MRIVARDILINVNQRSSIPSEETSRGIIERVSELYPKLLGVQGRLNVLRVNVGRRPMRKSGLRLEAENTTFVETRSDGFKTVDKPLKIVHCYGAGGNGYKLSWGAARMVVELVND